MVCVEKNTANYNICKLITKYFSEKIFERKRGETMEKIVEQLFLSMENEEEFQQLNKMLTAECEKRIQLFRKQLSTEEYEQIRDIVFSVSYLAQKSSFGIGFRTAVKLILECRAEEHFT